MKTSILQKIDTKECKGLFFRASSSTYLSGTNSIETRKSLRLLKRKSCPGCPKCSWFFEFVNEEIYNAESEDFIGEIKNGRIYTFNVHTSEVWESGFTEIDYVEFVEAKE